MPVILRADTAFDQVTVKHPRGFEVILVNLNGIVHGYRNSCPHIGIGLDHGDGRCLHPRAFGRRRCRGSCSGGAPWPLAALLRQLASRRFGFDVPQHGNKMGVFLHRETLEAALIKMPADPVEPGKASVPALRPAP